jgi:hypothetical protein
MEVKELRVVEIIIDLTNPNGKPSFNFYDITKETEKYLHSAKKYEWENGRRFYKKSLDFVHYPKKLLYTYQFKTDIQDYFEIEKSEQMQKAMRDLKQAIKRELDYYKIHFECIFDYYDKNYLEE